MITQFNNDTVRTLHLEVDAALKAIAEKHGLGYKGRSVTYHAADCPVGGIFLLKMVGGVPAEVAEFNRYCGMFNLTPEDFGAVITISREQWKLVGVMPSRPKFGYKFQNVSTGPYTGKVMLFTESVVAKIVAVWKPAAPAGPAA